MSYRIHRAMGWGMDWNTFEELTTIDCEAQDTSNKLDEILGSATDADLTVPAAERKRTWGNRGVNVIMDDRLLALDMEFTEGTVLDEDGHERRMRVEPELGRAGELYQLVMDPDNTHAVLFFPNVPTARQWNRRDDSLDYSFEAYRDGPPGRDGGAPRQFRHVMDFNPYPYSNYLMDKDGKPLEWVMFSALDREYPDGWYPAVASEIRWYLRKLNTLDDAGINRLRPMIAQWWC